MWEERFFKRNMQTSPLGGIRIACFVKNGIGVLTSRRVLPHFTLVYVVRGGGEYRDANGVSCPVSAGDAILVMPGIEHWYGPPSGESWDEIYLVFEGPVFDVWRQSGCIDTAKPVVSLHPQEFWRDKIMQAVGSGEEKTEDGLLHEAVRVQLLLADIQQALHEDVESDIVWLEDAQSALRKAMDVHDAARAMQQSYEAFRKKFKRLSGLSPGKYKSTLVMEQACAMLTDTDLLMRDISDALGFCDEYHFSRQFSKTIGWSPSEYRSRMR